MRSSQRVTRFDPRVTTSNQENFSSRATINNHCDLTSPPDANALPFLTSSLMLQFSQPNSAPAHPTAMHSDQRAILRSVSTALGVGENLPRRRKVAPLARSLAMRLPSMLALAGTAPPQAPPLCVATADQRNVDNLAVSTHSAQSVCMDAPQDSNVFHAEQSRGAPRAAPRAAEMQRQSLQSLQSLQSSPHALARELLDSPSPSQALQQEHTPTVAATSTTAAAPTVAAAAALTAPLPTIQSTQPPPHPPPRIPTTLPPPLPLRVLPPLLPAPSPLISLHCAWTALLDDTSRATAPTIADSAAPVSAEARLPPLPRSAALLLQPPEELLPRLVAARMRLLAAVDADAFQQQRAALNTRQGDPRRSASAVATAPAAASDASSLVQHAGEHGGASHASSLAEGASKRGREITATDAPVSKRARMPVDAPVVDANVDASEDIVSLQETSGNTASVAGANVSVQAVGTDTPVGGADAEDAVDESADEGERGADAEGADANDVQKLLYPCLAACGIAHRQLPCSPRATIEDFHSQRLRTLHSAYVAELGRCAERLQLLLSFPMRELAQWEHSVVRRWCLNHISGPHSTPTFVKQHTRPFPASPHSPAARGRCWGRNSAVLLLDALAQALCCACVCGEEGRAGWGQQQEVRELRGRVAALNETGSSTFTSNISVSMRFRVSCADFYIFVDCVLITRPLSQPLYTLPSPSHPQRASHSAAHTRCPSHLCACSQRTRASSCSCGAARRRQR